jgi:hypothetical protein
VPKHAEILRSKILGPVWGPTIFYKFVRYVCAIRLPAPPARDNFLNVFRLTFPNFPMAHTHTFRGGRFSIVHVSA